MPTEFTPEELLHWSTVSETPSGRLRHLKPVCNCRRRLHIGHDRPCRSAIIARSGQRARLHDLCRVAGLNMNSDKRIDPSSGPGKRQPVAKAISSDVDTSARCASACRLTDDCPMGATMSRSSCRFEAQARRTDRSWRVLTDPARFAAIATGRTQSSLHSETRVARHVISLATADCRGATSTFECEPGCACPLGATSIPLNSDATARDLSRAAKRNPLERHPTTTPGHRGQSGNNFRPGIIGPAVSSECIVRVAGDPQWPKKTTSH